MNFSPEDVVSIAQCFDIDLAAEPYLLRMIKQVASTPLPPNWTKVKSVDGRISYQQENEEPQDQHPAHAYFAKKVQSIDLGGVALTCFRLKRCAHKAISGRMSQQPFLSLRMNKESHTTTISYPIPGVMNLRLLQ